MAAYTASLPTLPGEGPMLTAWPLIAKRSSKTAAGSQREKAMQGLVAAVDGIKVEGCKFGEDSGWRRWDC
jgi:hypothetical protein